jgi:cobalt-zinc-cadmium efflux system outer membrane protein
MAVELNPTIAQADRLIRAAAGRKAQAALYPNPRLGYEAEEFSLKAPGRRSQSYLFLEQRIITGGKRGRRGELLNRGVEQAETRLELQRLRLLNDVRSAFYQALGAQRNAELRRELVRVSREAVEVSGQLFNIGQSDQPDLLAVEVEAEKAGLDLETAEIDLEKSWAALAAVIGDPELPQATLEGELELGEVPLNPEEALRKLLGRSPEVKLARGLVEESKAQLALARAQRFPDILVKGGLGYNQEVKEMQAILQIGVSLPLFDRNQGAIAAASAELETNELEVKRLELALRSRFDSAFGDYKKAFQRVGRYQREIVPRAQKAYDLYLARFREMTASYPQVLISLRTLFQSKSEYVASLVDLRRGLNALEGMLLTGGLRAPEGMAGVGQAESEEPAGLEIWRR